MFLKNILSISNEKYAWSARKFLILRFSNHFIMFRGSRYKIL